jgi:hypothetical protein
VVRGVPILGEDDVLEMLRGAVNGVDDSVAVGNGECAARAEIVLQVDDKEGVLRCDLHGDLGQLIDTICSLRQ